MKSVCPKRLFSAAALLCLVGSVVALAQEGQGGSESLSVRASDFTKHAVAADHELASQAGAELLAAGGTAADAAAATMLTLGVVSPASSGLGGGGFALYYKASDKSLTFLDFREMAPSAATPEMFAQNDAKDGPASRPSQLGGLASGVPGEAAGIDELLKRFGKKTWADVTKPAIRHARDGFILTEYISRFTVPFGDQMLKDRTMRKWFPEPKAPIPPGTRIKMPELERTLRLLGKKGVKAFYEGSIARAIVKANKAEGGLMTMADLKNYRVVEREPLRGEHFGRTWYTAPPPSAGGYTMLASLALLERWLPADRVTRMDHELVHAFAESWKGPFWDRASYFGDPDHVDVPVAALMDETRLTARAREYRRQLATPVARYEHRLPDRPVPEKMQSEEHGTSHLCVVDAEGNVAAITTTVNLPFGARYTAAGIVMNDEMDDFASAVGEANAFGLPGGEANLPGPGKRPVSTMSPTIVIGAQGPELCIGAAGGSRIVTATQQVAWHSVVRGLPLGEAASHPRIHHQGSPDRLRVEQKSPLPAETIEQLKARGHDIEEVSHSAVVQAIRMVRNGSGSVTKLEAVSDPRKGGKPAGE